jgi:tetratricopeptide (TPR) repeat protein
LRLALPLLCLVAAVGIAVGPAAAQNDRIPVGQATTVTKARFVENLVTSSVAVRTIEASNDAVAMDRLAKARVLVAAAKEDLAAQNPLQANEKLDEALRMINLEVRRLSRTEMRHQRAEEAYEKRLHAVRTFLKAYERVAQEKSVSEAAAEQTKEIRALLDAAEKLAGQQKFTDATVLLDRAYRTARGDIRSLRQGETLTRSLSFATPRDEYRYEHDRNDSHQMLLRFAISEKHPPAIHLKRINQMKDDATRLRQQAENEAATNDFQQAIVTIGRSTETLLKAIRMSGLFVPG